MSRYYEPDQATLDMVEEVRRERFGHLANANIKVIMDSKEKINKTSGKVEFAYIKKPNDVENFLIAGDEEYEYFLFIHELVWELANHDNRKRIISHELRHAHIDEKGNYKIIPHEIEDFFMELELNNEDPRWGKDLEEMVRLTYEQRKEDGQI